MQIKAKKFPQPRMQGSKRSYEHRREPWREVTRKLEVANAKLKWVQIELKDANEAWLEKCDELTAAEEQATIYETDVYSVIDEMDKLKTALQSIDAVQVDPAGNRGMTLFNALARCKQIATEVRKED